MSSKSKSRTDFICRVRYRNTLPPVPFPPKLLTMPSLIDRHIPYKTNSLVEQTPYSLAMESGSTAPFERSLIDYLDVMEVNPDEATQLEEYVAEEDKILLTTPRDEQRPAGKGGRKTNVTWLRRSEYIAADTRTSTLRREAMEHKFAMSAREAARKNYSTYEGQIVGIEKTFAAPSLTLQHPRTRAKAKRIIPVLPDMTTWENTYMIGQFNGEPADEKRMHRREELAKRAAEAQQGTSGIGKKRPSEEDGTDRGVLHPITVTDPDDPEDEGDSFLIWFLPDEQSTSRLKALKADPYQELSAEPLTYYSVREYEYVNDNAPRSQHMLLAMHQEGDEQQAVYSLVKSKLTAKQKRATNKRFRKLEEDEGKPDILKVTLQ